MPAGLVQNLLWPPSTLDRVGSSEESAGVPPSTGATSTGRVQAVQAAQQADQGQEQEPGTPRHG